MRSKSIMHGVNVPISPTSTADAKLTNNITISNVAYPNLESKSDTDPSDPLGSSCRNPYIHTVNQEIHNKFAEGSDIKTRELIPETLDSYLLKLYQTILLSDNKKLIANVVSKRYITLTTEDLEKIIELKVGKKCKIEYEDPEVACFKIETIFFKIASIRIIEDINTQSDFKIKYNRDYLELITNYKLNLKFVLVND